MKKNINAFVWLFFVLATMGLMNKYIDEEAYVITLGIGLVSFAYFVFFYVKGRKVLTKQQEIENRKRNFRVIQGGKK